MEIALKCIHIFASLILITVVLLQSGRGGGMGAGLSGASGQIFGGRGAGNFLTGLTSGVAVVFFLTSLTLSMMSSQHRSVLMGQKAPASEAPESTPVDAEEEDAAAADDVGDASAGAAAPSGEAKKAAATAPRPRAAKGKGEAPAAGSSAAQSVPRSSQKAVAPPREATPRPAKRPGAPAPTPPGVPTGEP